MNVVIAVASLASVLMSAALFGRRGRSASIDDPSPPPPPPPRTLEQAEPEDVSGSDSDRSELEEPAVETADASDAEPDRPADAGSSLLGGSLLADLEARIQTVQPAPHPVRPQEMWHPGVAPLPVDLPAHHMPEEQVDRSDLEDGDGTGGRFRFNRLRRVSHGDELSDDGTAPRVDHRLPAEPESVGDVLFGELFTSDRIPSSTEALGSGAAPLVPPSGGAAGSLITGPVARPQRDADRPLLPPLPPEDLPGLVAPSSAEETPGRGSASPVAPDAAEVTATPQPDPTPAPDPVFEPRPVAIGADGSVAVAGASVRLAVGASAIATELDDAVAVMLHDGWCWAALGEGAAPVTISLTDGSVQCAPGTSVLVALEDDDSFVVVVRGEATMTMGRKRIRLRTGAMAFTPAGAAEPQVDIASAEEIKADPLVAQNLQLDANYHA